MIGVLLFFLTTNNARASSSDSPQISCDDHGHVYVAWKDSSNGNPDIYLNHSSDHGATWQPTDIRLDTDPPGAARSRHPEVSNDQDGHVSVIWWDDRNGEYDIYLNYSWDYGATWQASDIRLDTDPPGTAESRQARISSDNSGHVYVSWIDNRNGKYDIYFNYSSDYGATWQSTDRRLDTDPLGAADSKHPEIRSDRNGHVFVAWIDFRNGKGDIYLNSSSDYGATWRATDIRLDTGPPGVTDSREPEISIEEEGSVYVAWSEFQDGGSDIYFNYSLDYGETWQPENMRLNTNPLATSYSVKQEISSDENGRVYVTWNDDRNGEADIYFNYSSDYGATWQTSDLRLDTDSAGTGYSEEPRITSDDSGHVYVAWKDNRNGNNDIYFNSSSDYGATWQPMDIRLDTDPPGSADSRHARMSSDGNCSVYVAWKDNRIGGDGGNDIYFNYSSDCGATWRVRDRRLNSRKGPNLVLVLTDDQRWDTVDYMPHVKNDLLSSGVYFANSYVTTPLCAPSRASTLTGQYAHNHGVLRNRDAVDFDDSSTLATWLQEAGYKTALVGKYLNNYHLLSPYIPPGWDAWYVFVEPGYFDYSLNENGEVVSYGSAEADYSTDVLAAKAVSFIQGTEGQPFFLMFTPHAPHTPAIPAPRHVGSFAELPPWRPPNYNEADVSDKPSWVRNLELFTLRKQERLDEFRIAQIESLQAVDEAIGHIMKALRDTGRDDNTVIVYSSDHGVAWGEHRWKGKRAVYEEIIRVPMVVRRPGPVPVPRNDDRIVLNIDLALTLVDLAGISIPQGVDGKSIIALLDGTAESWRRSFLVEHWRGGKAVVPDYAGILRRKWKYVEYMGEETELYDLYRDPYELENVTDDPTYATKKAKLRDKLQHLKDK